tara:strand:- start:252 stop:1127 length:876 start_codon:yes stop_codon:yes gene_type:complete
MTFGPPSGGGGGAVGTDPRYTQYTEVRRRESSPGAKDWFDMVPDATGYENLEFIKVDDPYVSGDDDDGDVPARYYTVGVEKDETYQRDFGDEGESEYDQQAHYEDLFNNSTEFDQGYFIDRKSMGEDEEGYDLGYEYFLSQKEGYEALNPTFTSYDSSPEDEPGPPDVGIPEPPGAPDPDPEPPTPPEPPVDPRLIIRKDPPGQTPVAPVPGPVTPPGEVPPDPPEPGAPPVVDPPGSPTNPITPRSPYAGLEDDDEERGRPRRGRRRTRTIMTSGLLGSAPVTTKTLLGS